VLRRFEDYSIYMTFFSLDNFGFGRKLGPNHGSNIGAAHHSESTGRGDGFHATLKAGEQNDGITVHFFTPNAVQENI
jgi:hypothetical protein